MRKFGIASGSCTASEIFDGYNCDKSKSVRNKIIVQRAERAGNDGGK